MHLLLQFTYLRKAWTQFSARSASCFFLQVMQYHTVLAMFTYLNIGKFWPGIGKKSKIRIENQYPKNWSDRVVFRTLNKINEGKKNLEVKASEPRNDKWLKDSPPFLQCNVEAIHLKCYLQSFSKFPGHKWFLQQENWKHASHPSRLTLLVNWDPKWCISSHVVDVTPPMSTRQSGISHEGRLTPQRGLLGRATLIRM